MKRKFLFQTALLAALVFLMFGCIKGKEHQKKEIDQEAISLLHKISENVIGSTNKSFTLTVDEEKTDSTGTVSKTHSVNMVKAIKPNKLFVEHTQDGRDFNYWYDGDFFTYYNKTENNYVRLEAPTTTTELIDEMHTKFDFKFPAGDFFYPSLKEDFESFFTLVKMDDTETIDGEDFTKIIATNDSSEVEILVYSNKMLPKSLKITNKINKEKYKATFSNWDTKTTVSDSAFISVIPKEAQLIQIMSKL